MAGWVGPAISAGASLLGGLIDSGKSSVGQSYELAKKIGKKQIQWRVKDAKKAGIHPMFAIGAPSMGAPGFSGGSSLGDSVAAAGQDVGRAVESLSTRDERAYTDKLRALQLQRGELENTLLASKIARLGQAGGAGPPSPSMRRDITGNEMSGDLALMGNVWESSPFTSDAQRWAQRHGEPAEWAVFPFTVASDWDYNRRKKNVAPIDNPVTLLYRYGRKGAEWLRDYFYE